MWVKNELFYANQLKRLSLWAKIEEDNPFIIVSLTAISECNIYWGYNS